MVELNNIQRRVIDHIAGLGWDAEVRERYSDGSVFVCFSRDLGDPRWNLFDGDRAWGVIGARGRIDLQTNRFMCREKIRSMIGVEVFMAGRRSTASDAETGGGV